MYLSIAILCCGESHWGGSCEGATCGGGCGGGARGGLSKLQLAISDPLVGCSCSLGFTAILFYLMSLLSSKHSRL